MSRAPSQAAPRALLRAPPPGGRRQARRKTRCNAVVKDTVNATVIRMPMNPVAVLARIHRLIWAS
jgi:hypothetical protein